MSQSEIKNRSEPPSNLNFLKNELGKIMNALDHMETPDEQASKKQEENDDMKHYKEKVIKTMEFEIIEAKKTFRASMDRAITEFDKSLDQTFDNLKSIKFDSKNESILVQSKEKYYCEKVFTHKESVLTELFRFKEDFRTIYHIALASMFLLMINLVFQDYIETGNFFDFETMIWCFQHYDVVFKGWCSMIIYSFLVIPFVKMIVDWKIKKTIWIPIYTVSQIALSVWATFIVVRYDLPFGSSMIVLCECFRICMKIHSYLRNKLLYGVKDNFFTTFLPPDAIKRGITIKDLNIPNIKIGVFSEEFIRYGYFLLAPTLVYRDEYPKRARRNINFLLFNLINCILTVYYAFILFKTFMKPQFAHVGKEPGTFSGFLLSIFKSILPGIISLMLIFYGLLHSWFNLWAEIMRFPDRRFYEDWWNSLEFGTYYRKWNIVVHDFLYNYVYLDLNRFSKGKFGRDSCQLLTFLISAVIHEWILTYAIGFFYPMLFIIFTGPGIILIRNSRNNKSKQLNIFFWTMMFVGTGLLLVLYSREYYARQMVSADKVNKEYGWVGVFMPRSLFVLLHQQ